MRQVFSRAAALGACLAVLGSAGSALAHHPMGGATPSTLGEGLLSGLGHPIIGIDHLAFVVAVGLAAAFTPRSWLSPLAFVGATLLGCLLLLGGVVLPIVEFVISASVVLVGAAILSGRAIQAWVYAVLFAIAGLFHGFAYGEAIIGAETGTVLAYLVGFAAVQYAIALAVAYGVRALVREAGPAGARQGLWNAVGPRLAGAVVAGVGLAFFLEAIEGALLA